MYQGFKYYYKKGLKNSFKTLKKAKNSFKFLMFVIQRSFYLLTDSMTSPWLNSLSLRILFFVKPKPAISVMMIISAFSALFAWAWTYSCHKEILWILWILWERITSVPRKDRLGCLWILVINPKSVIDCYALMTDLG